MTGVVNVGNDLKLGGGAKFWAYVSPQNNTSDYVTKWTVEISQQNGNWMGRISSENPEQHLETPNLSGLFNVKVTASGPNLPETTLKNVDWSPANIGCNSNCSSMVGIIATEDGTGANYWTTWDAICSAV